MVHSGLILLFVCCLLSKSATADALSCLTIAIRDTKQEKQAKMRKINFPIQSCNTAAVLLARICSLMFLVCLHRSFASGVNIFCNSISLRSTFSLHNQQK
jgi:hypothetical protein